MKVYTEPEPAPLREPSLVMVNFIFGAVLGAMLMVCAVALGVLATGSVPSLGALLTIALCIFAWLELGMRWTAPYPNHDRLTRARHRTPNVLLGQGDQKRRW